MDRKEMLESRLEVVEYDLEEAKKQGDFLLARELQEDLKEMKAEIEELKKGR